MRIENFRSRGDLVEDHWNHSTAARPARRSRGGADGSLPRTFSRIFPPLAGLVRCTAARMDEQRAIQLCLKHRDPIGFEFLVRQYRREAYRHAYGLLGNQQDALDACQDAFARAFASLPRLAALTRFYPWFYRILRNRCLNVIARRQTSERYRKAQSGVEPEAGPFPEPRAAIEDDEERRSLRQALARLRPDYHEILTLKYLEEHSYQEISTLLGIPRGTVMSRLHAARIALRTACSTTPVAGPLATQEHS
jgi:RNA polymerase sigma-70 factor, ECF subfamily